MPELRMIELPQYDDAERGGTLVPIEHNTALPFEPKRTYYLMNVPTGNTRGAHAHLLEEEVFICIRGRVTMRFSTDGSPKQSLVLRRANEAVYVPKLVWHEFCEFSPDAILLCFSSVNYLPGNINYITQWEDFVEMAQSS